MSLSKVFESKSTVRFFPSRVSIGARTELAALAYLRANGCRLVARNVRFRVGEIDLIMRDGNDLVFVEVRGRREGSLEAAEVALPPQKRRKLGNAIELYLLKQDPAERAEFRAIRIDFLSTNGTAWFWYKNIELR